MKSSVSPVTVSFLSCHHQLNIACCCSHQHLKWQNEIINGSTRRGRRWHFISGGDKNIEWTCGSFNSPHPPKKKKKLSTKTKALSAWLGNINIILLISWHSKVWLIYAALDAICLIEYLLAADGQPRYDAPLSLGNMKHIYIDEEAGRTSRWTSCNSRLHDSHIGLKAGGVLRAARALCVCLQVQQL